MRERIRKKEVSSGIQSVWKERKMEKKNWGRRRDGREVDVMERI
jgi:hypothetical protein